jgi:phosphoglycerate dehydrogenase-like enzyme
MVAGYGIAFGMRVVACDVREQAFAEAPDGVERVELEGLLALADVVSLHVPFDESTRGLMGAHQFGLMREGAVLVNTSRGEVVDEVCLVRMLRERRLGGVALDVLAEDVRWPNRLPKDIELLELARSTGRAILTPHTGGYGRRSVARTRAFIVEKLSRNC